MHLGTGGVVNLRRRRPREVPRRDLNAGADRESALHLHCMRVNHHDLAQCNSLCGSLAAAVIIRRVCMWVQWRRRRAWKYFCRFLLLTLERRCSTMIPEKLSQALKFYCSGHQAGENTHTGLHEYNAFQTDKRELQRIIYLALSL